MSRSTMTDFPEVYRLVITTTYGDVEETTYIGPYQTIGAARGQLTHELKPRYHQHYSKKVGRIERTTGPWETV